MAENSYSVKFTPKAVDDLDEIYSYISGELLVELC
jgi:plasmid stabilization system protein ParE